MTTPKATQAVEVTQEAAIAKIVADCFEDGGGCVDGPDWDWDTKEAEKRALDAAREIRALSTPTDATAVENHPAIVTAIGGYGGRCRDCADMGDGVCENRGLPCGERKYDAIRHVLRALAYYRENPHFLDQIDPRARTKES